MAQIKTTPSRESSWRSYRLIEAAVAYDLDSNAYTLLRCVLAGVPQNASGLALAASDDSRTVTRSSISRRLSSGGGVHRLAHLFGVAVRRGGCRAPCSRSLSSGAAARLAGRIQHGLEAFRTVAGKAAQPVWDSYHVKNVVTNGQTTSSGGVQQGQSHQVGEEGEDQPRSCQGQGRSRGGTDRRRHRPVKCGDGDPDIRVLWGAVNKKDVKWTAKAFDNANNQSVVVKVSFGKSSLLITGNLEEDGIAALVDAHASALDADVHEVGHGLHNATSKELLEAIRPKIAIIGVESNERHVLWAAWKYGHPRLRTIELLEGIPSGTPRAEIEEPVGTAARPSSSTASQRRFRNGMGQ